MGTTENGPNLEELAAKLVDLERTNIQMREQLIALRNEQTTTDSQSKSLMQAKPFRSSQTPVKGAKSWLRSRRGLLGAWLGIAAASVGAGVLIKTSTDATQASAAQGPTPAGTQGPTTFNNNGGNSPAVTANSTSSANSKVNAIKGTSSGYTGIAGYTNSTSLFASGVYGQGPTVGVAGQVNGSNIIPNARVGVYGTAGNQNTLNVGGVGVWGASDTYYGVSGTSRGGGSTTDSAGVAGFTTSTSGTDAGVLGEGPNGVIGLVTGAIKDGLYGSTGVYGSGSSGPNGPALYGYGVYGVSDGGIGVVGYTGQGGTGVFGSSYGTYATGVYGYGDYIGVDAQSDNGTAVWAYTNTGLAGEFDGDTNVNGTLTKSSGAFKIDHPLDPANKYLYHSFVESPDMKNVYDGVVTLDASGSAVVTMPNWFSALNTEFRYQLTAIGTAAPNLHIAAEISNNSFKIGGGTVGMKVCWQVTGNRQDPWAKAHPIPVEQQKTSSQQGHYLHPELYGHASELDIMAASHDAAQQWHKRHTKLPKK